MPLVGCVFASKRVMVSLWIIAAAVFVLLGVAALLTGWGGFVLIIAIPVVVGVLILWKLLARSAA